MVRHLAVIQLITGESGTLSSGTGPQDTVAFNCEPIVFTAGVSIDEENVKAAPELSDEEADATPADDDDDHDFEDADDGGEADDES
tara:strand:- start:1374 stop:1631 length:258 start_codon:yes stop_codon:yes gene_type:complete